MAGCELTPQSVDKQMRARPRVGTYHYGRELMCVQVRKHIKALEVDVQHNVRPSAIIVR
jgi:hypothetical protein